MKLVNELLCVERFQRSSTSVACTISHLFMKDVERDYQSVAYNGRFRRSPTTSEEEKKDDTRQ